MVPFNNKYIILLTSIACLAPMTQTTALDIKTVDYLPDTPEWQNAFAVDMAETPLAEKPAIDLEGTTKYMVTYKGSLAGVNLGNLKIESDLSEDVYRMRYQMEQKGVARWFSQQDTRAEAYGVFLPSESGLKMRSLYYYTEDYNSGDDDQIVEISRGLDEDRFRLYTNPSYNLTRPVPLDDAIATVDPLSALALLGYSDVPEGASPCDRLVESYDGKRLFNMRMTDDGTKVLKNRSSKRYEGPVFKCRVFQDKIKGYKQKNLDKKDEAKAWVYLAKVPDSVSRPSLAYVPVMLVAKAGIATAVLEAKNPIIIGPDGTLVNMGVK